MWYQVCTDCTAKWFVAARPLSECPRCGGSVATSSVEKKPWQQSGRPMPSDEHTGTVQREDKA